MSPDNGGCRTVFPRKPSKIQTKQQIRRRNWCRITFAFSFFCLYNGQSGWGAWRRRLPIEREKLPYEIPQAIDIENLTVRQTGKGKIQLKRKTGQLDPDTVGQPGGLPESEMEALSEIIKELNERFSTEFSEEDRLVIHQIEQKLAQDGRLGQTLRVNTPENAMLAFRQVLQELFQDILETNFKFYQNMDNNPDFAERLTAILFERYRKSMQNGVAG
jgi:type I restriction enzyme, R subunit